MDAVPSNTRQQAGSAGSGGAEHAMTVVRDAAAGNVIEFGRESLSRLAAGVRSPNWEIDFLRAFDVLVEAYAPANAAEWSAAFSARDVVFRRPSQRIRNLLHRVGHEAEQGREPTRSEILELLRFVLGDEVRLPPRRGAGRRRSRCDFRQLYLFPALALA